VFLPFSYRVKIRTRLILLCLGVAAPLLVIGSVSLFEEYKTLKQEAQRATRFQNAIAVRSLEHWIGSQLDTVKAVASLSTFQTNKPDSVMRVLNTALEAQSAWTEIFIVNRAGTVAHYATANGPEGIEETVKLDPLFAASIFDNREPIISNYTESPLTQRPALLIGAPIISQGKARAALIVSVDPKAVLKLFQGLGETEGAVIDVIDANKRVVARTLNDDYWEGKDFSGAKTVRAAEQSLRGDLEGVGIADSTARAYAFEHIPGLNWLVIIGVPSNAIYGSAHNWLTIMILLAGCAVIASLCLAFLATSHFTRNIHLLVKEALALGRGDLSKRVQVKAKDELGTLAEAFNEMATRLELDQEQKIMVENISEAIRQSLDLEQILHTTVRELGRALEASRCCLALIDDSNEENNDTELVFNHVWYDRANGGVPLAHKSIVITPKSVMRIMLEQGSILSLDVLEEDSSTPLFENDQNSPEDWRSIRSLIACPISDEKRPVGLILVHQCDRPRVWTDAELELVEATARHVVLAMQQARLYARTKAMADQEMLISRIVRSVRSSLELDTILNTVTEELCTAMQVDRCQIAQPRQEGPLVITHEFHAADLKTSKGVNLYSEPIDFRPEAGTEIRYPGRNFVLGIDLSKMRTDPVPPLPPPENNGQVQDPASEDTVREAPIAIINNTETDSRTLPFQEFIYNTGARSLIAAPLISENRLIGLLIVQQCKTQRTWKPREVQLVAAIADQLAIAVTHAHLFAQVKYQAITDGLTGLYNHIYFKNRLGEEIRLAKRKGTPCSLLMIDLDKLKEINDNFGHPVGDAAIRQVAGILKNLLRSGDTAARYGGEEFGVILPETSLLEAALIGDRLCAQIASAHVPGLGRITASIGAAAYPKQANDMGDLVEKADRALYAAKNSGRNQIWIYDEAEQAAHSVEGGIPQRLSMTNIGQKDATATATPNLKPEWNG
jgi:diguanylate cyclase (GGDEF)-like protein